MMLCLAIYMGVQVYSPPTFIKTETPLLMEALGFYNDKTHTAVLFVDSILVKAHEAAHHLQHMNNLPYDEVQAMNAAHHYILECVGEMP